METYRWINVGISFTVLINSLTQAVLLTKIVVDSEPQFIDGWDKFGLAVYWVVLLQSIVLLTSSLMVTGQGKRIFHNTLAFPIIGLAALASLGVATFLFKRISDVGSYPGGVNFYEVWYIVTYLL